MIIFRIIEKLNLTCIVHNDVTSYVITCVGTIVGSINF